jgi:hypothetical protein
MFFCVLCLILIGTLQAADTPAKPPTPASGPANAGGAAVETDLVKKTNAARKEYQQSLVALYKHYEKAGDNERLKWAEDELKQFHLMNKPSYRLDIDDVPGADLVAKENIKEANEIFVEAMKYKDHGSGNEFVLNQKRAELLFKEILTKHNASDKIADVAYQLGELYEGKAFKQFDRAALYYERAFQWRKGTRTDARLRAATLYDRVLNERSKAIELYREQIANDTDAERIKLAEKRLSELTTRSGGSAKDR